MAIFRNVILFIRSHSCIEYVCLYRNLCSIDNFSEEYIYLYNTIKLLILYYTYKVTNCHNIIIFIVCNLNILFLLFDIYNIIKNIFYLTMEEKNIYY